MARGHALLRHGDYIAAADDYSAALAVEPAADIRLHRGWAYFFAEAYRPAVHDFQTALEENPELAPAYVGRGLARIMLGEMRPAVADADEAVRLGIASPEQFHNVACIYALSAGRAIRENAAFKALAETYADRALAMLRRSLALVPAERRRAFFDQQVLPDRALDAVRPRLKYLELVPEERR